MYECISNTSRRCQHKMETFKDLVAFMTKPTECLEHFLIRDRLSCFCIMESAASGVG